MKRIGTLLIAALFAAAVPAASLAQHHGSSGHGGHGNGAPNSRDSHGQTHGNMEELGVAVVDGVKAVALLDDVSEAMAGAGMKDTHHFMVYFVEEQTGARLGSGTVALKVKGPGGTESNPIPMAGMEDGFGADIAMTIRGHYELKVGSRLADGKNRQFEFMYMLD